jgi:AcrR family transcriptional regulator
LDEILFLVEMVEQIAKDELMVREKKLVAQYGLKRTTMEDIATAMGKGKSTLYYYFTNKTDIFEAVVNKELKNFLRLTRQAINIAVTAKDKLKV